MPISSFFTLRSRLVRVVIEIGRPMAHVAAEICVGEQLLGAGGDFDGKRPRLAILARCLMPMTGAELARAPGVGNIAQTACGAPAANR
jgi:hypothetical protein